MLPRRLLLAVAVAGVALAGVGATVVASAAETATPSTTHLVQPAACRVPAPTTAAGYQAMFNAKTDNTWSGGDQAASVALPDGRVLWLFGDSVRGAQLADGSRDPSSSFVRNSALVQDAGCLRALTARAEVVPNRADGQWFWPQTAVVQGSSLLVLCARVEGTGSGAFDFRTTGMDIAVFSLRSGLPRFERMAPTPSSNTPESGFQYGKAVVREGDWLYVYGTRQVTGAFGREVGVARVRNGSLLTPRAWQFWNGKIWSPDSDSPAPLADNWSTAFSVWSDGDDVLHSLTKADDVYGHAVVAGIAPSTTSPFATHVLFEAPSGQRPGELRYNALAHPEAGLADGALLVTVCRNNAGLAAVFADAQLYKPQFTAVSLH